MIVRTNKSHGEYVVVLENITALFTVINGEIYAKCLPRENSFINDMPGVIVFFGNFMDSVKRKPAAR